MAIGATSGAATGHQPFPLAAEVPETGGSTTPSIAAELRIGTGRPPTDSGERRAVTRSPTARPAPGNRSDGRAAICRVPAGQEPERAIGRAEAWAVGRAEAAGQIALEAATSRAAVAETGTPLEEAPGAPRDTTDRALAPVAAAAPPAWDLAVAGAAVAAVGGADDVCLFEEKKSRSSK